MFDDFSPSAVRAVSAAGDEAQRLGHQQIGTEHLLLGLLAADDSGASALLRDAGASASAARHTVAQVGGSTSSGSADVGFTPRAQRALERAGRFARRERVGAVSDVHVLLGVLDVEGLACQVLRSLDVDVGRLRRSADGTDLDQDIEVDPAIEEITDVAHAAGVRPNCPRCEAPLDEHLAVSVVAARDAPDGSVRAYYCGACGATLAITTVMP